MRIAEQVTFGGGGLDRRADLRSEEDIVGTLSPEHTCVALALWRGKPLFDMTDEPQIVRLALSDPLLAYDQEAPVFLGTKDGTAYFAYDVSAWEPPDGVAMPDGFFDLSEQTHPDRPATERFAELRAVMARLTPLDAELAATAKSIHGWHNSHGYCAKCGAPTNVFMGGWQRKCGTCAAMHFPRTDPVVIMLVTHGNDTLLGRSPGWPDRMYSLLAGFLEPGETIAGAVRREVFEEAGIHVGDVKVLASQPWPYPSSLMIACASNALSRDIVLDPKELDGAVWISRETLFQSLSGEVDWLKPARKGSIAHFILQNWLAGKLG